MINLIKKDMVLIASSRQSLAFSLLYIPIVSFLDVSEGAGSLARASILTFTYMLVIMSFSFGLKSKPDMMLLSLPVKRSEVVISKYILGLAVYLPASVYCLICLSVMRSMGLYQGAEISLIEIVSDSALPVAGLVAIGLPIHFLLVPKIANFLSTMTYMFWLMFFGFSDKMPQILKSMGVGETLLSIAVLTVASASVSLIVYNRKNYV